jgi:hypothetical protein
VAALTGSSLDFAVTLALPDVVDDLLPCQPHRRRHWGGAHWPRSFKNGFKNPKIWDTSQNLFFQCTKDLVDKVQTVGVQGKAEYFARYINLLA